MKWERDHVVKEQVTRAGNNSFSARTQIHMIRFPQKKKVTVCLFEFVRSTCTIIRHKYFTIIGECGCVQILWMSTFGCQILEQAKNCYKKNVQKIITIICLRLLSCSDFYYVKKKNTKIITVQSFHFTLILKYIYKGMLCLS